MRLRLVVAAAAGGAALTLGACASAAPHPAVSGSWRGTFVLPTLASVSAEFSGGRVDRDAAGRPSGADAGRGHARPGRAGAVRAAGPADAARLQRPPARPRDSGTVTQAGLRGTFVLRRGKPLATGSLGVYRLDSGAPLSVTQPAGQRLLVDYDGSRIHGLFAAGGSRWDVGSGLGTRRPVTGTAVFSRDRLELGSQRATRIPQVEREVRFRSGRTWLAGTLAVPAGASGRPGVVLVHGSGATTRNDPAVLASYFEAQGFAVLTYDKRGIGQSGGEYPGEAATDASIDVTRATLPPPRGSSRPSRRSTAAASASQARARPAGSRLVAATREPSIRFLALVSRPDRHRRRGERVRGADDPGRVDPGRLARRDPRPGAAERPERLRPGARAPAARDPVALALRRARPARADARSASSASPAPAPTSASSRAPTTS